MELDLQGNSRDDRFSVFRGFGRTLFLSFLLFSLLPLAVVGWLSYENARDSMLKEEEKALVEAIALKEIFLDSYFHERVVGLNLQAESDNNRRLLTELHQAYQQSGVPLRQFVESETYTRTASKFATDLRRFQEMMDYYDILLLDKDGNVLFTVLEENDHGTNLLNGPYRHTRFSQISNKALETGKPFCSDMILYGPSGNRIAFFLVKSITSLEGETLGLLAFQVDMKSFSSIIEDTTGLGKTGQTFLVGNDRQLRSRLRYGSRDDILRKEVNTEIVHEWLMREERRHGEHANQAGVDHFELDEVHSYREDDGHMVLGVGLDLISLGKYDLHWLLVAEVDEDEAYAPVYKLERILFAIFLVTIIVVLIGALFLSRRIVGPIVELTNWARQVAIGDLTEWRIQTPENEIGRLNSAMRDIILSFQNVVEQARRISTGDLPKEVVPRSDKDTLGVSLAEMVASLRLVVGQANTIAQGDFTNRISPRSQQDLLGNAMHAMTNTLRQMAEVAQRVEIGDLAARVLIKGDSDLLGRAINTMIENIAQQDWLKSTESELNDLMRGEQNLTVMAETVLSSISRHLKANVAAFFVLEDDVLRLISSYAYKIRHSNDNQFRLGEGMVGQAALERETIIFRNVPEDHITLDVNSGLGVSVPKSIVVVPLLHDNKVRGVIEFGCSRDFSQLEIMFLEKVAESIAINLHSSQSRQRMQELLEETQAQSEELQAQQHELKAANEELEEQTIALKESQQMLEEQSEELRTSNEELEEKTEYLEKQQVEINRARTELEEKARDLELASKYKTEFLANMSHELRSPLNSLLILAKILEENGEGNLNAEQVESARIIYEGGRELLELINDILDLSKVEAGKFDVQCAEMKFSYLLQDLQDQFVPLAKEKGLACEMEVATEITFDGILTDEKRVKQILKNLLSNAIKFTSHGSVKLRIETVSSHDLPVLRSGLKETGAVAFSVSDTGIGVAADKQRAIFEAFQQADGSTSRQYGGTGLGLTISRQFAKLLGGEIQLVSREGEGSTFTLYLPVALSENKVSLGDDDLLVVEKDERATEPVVKEVIDLPGKDTLPTEFIDDDRVSCKPGDKTILFIEDDPNFAQILKKMAKAKGYKVIAAGNGRSGLLLAEDYQPKAIILDLGLPDIDGVTVLDNLKNHLATRHIPVHIISARDESAEILQKGAIGYLTKPANADNLGQIFTRFDELLSEGIKRLLIVEDDLVSRDNIIRLLGGQEIQIDVAATGAEAQELLVSHNYDAVILDLGLPDIGGFELLSRLDAIPDFNLPPVIVYTGRELTEDENDRLQEYAGSVVVKGADSQERLLDEVSLFLHSVESALPSAQREIILMMHDRDQVFKDKKIMLVDDDMRNTFALSHLLKKNGMEVVMASNGKMALEQLQEEKNVDLILMDIMMPVMDGYAATREIRNMPKYKDLPIIALTAKAMPEDRQLCLEAGVNDYLAKPIDEERLFSLMRVWLF